jgi:hypothetical protein
MLCTPRAAAIAIVGGLAWTILAGAGRADPPAKEVKDLLPSRKHAALKGNVVGVLLIDGQQFLNTEGRHGPPDQLCFSSGGCSYRWVYVPVADNAPIKNLQVPVGDNGQIQVYPALDLARPKNVKPLGVETAYTLVEVQVNNGQGSPKNDSFVITQIRVLEGTKDYPLKTGDVIKQMQQKFAQHVKDQSQAIDESMAKAAKGTLTKEQKVTGPREKNEVMYVTWLPETERLRVHFRVKITDGSYTVVGGGAIPVDKVPLPPDGKPGPGGKRLPPPPPPPREIKVKVGTSFGVEFGVMYEIDKTGKLLTTEVVPFTQFTERVQMPAGPPGDGPRFELPPPPKKQ